jgi:hypothetical protein
MAAFVRVFAQKVTAEICPVQPFVMLFLFKQLTVQRVNIYTALLSKVKHLYYFGGTVYFE